MRLTIDLFGYRLDIHPNKLGDDNPPDTYDFSDRGTTASVTELDGQPDAGELKHRPLQAPTVAFGFKSTP